MTRRIPAVCVVAVLLVSGVASAQMTPAEVAAKIRAEDKLFLDTYDERELTPDIERLENILAEFKTFLNCLKNKIGPRKAEIQI